VAVGGAEGREEGRDEVGSAGRWRPCAREWPKRRGRLRAASAVAHFLAPVASPASDGRDDLRAQVMFPCLAERRSASGGPQGFGGDGRREKEGGGGVYVHARAAHGRL